MAEWFCRQNTHCKAYIRSYIIQAYAEVYIMVHVINQNNFEEEVLKAPGKVLVDFWATWCGPCRMQGPIVDELSEERSDVKFCKLDVDDNMDIAQTYRVMSIPTLILFENGEIRQTMVGLRQKAELNSALG